MAQNPIQKTEWSAFCEQFSRAHRGWRVAVQRVATRWLANGVTGAADKLHWIAENRSLLGVRVEGADGQEAAVIELEGNGTRVRHRVFPLEALFTLTVDQADEGLRIDDGVGETTLVRFRVPAMPESLDGLSPTEREG